jgi:nitrogen fixation protein NifU and related proteins
VIKDPHYEVILRHYQSAANRRLIPDPDLEGSAQNPLCGDELTIFARLEENRIADAAFQARSCSISQASADMMADIVRGKTLDEAISEIERFEGMMRGETPEHESVQDIDALASVRRFPSRVKCALMPWTTLGEAIERRGAAR